MSGSVAMVVDRMASVVDAVRALTTQRVMVGIPAARGVRNGDGAITNAALGYIHENGAPEVGIPARPFLVPGVRSVEAEIQDGLRTAGEMALDGRREAVTQQLNRVGLIASSAVKRKINEGVPPPLAPSTLRARARMGAKGTKPLIRTGQLRNSITYVIR